MDCDDDVDAVGAATAADVVVETADADAVDAGANDGLPHCERAALERA